MSWANEETVVENVVGYVLERLSRTGDNRGIQKLESGTANGSTVSTSQ